MPPPSSTLRCWRNGKTRRWDFRQAASTYQFWRRGTTAEGERWLPLGDDELLQARALPTPFGVAVQEYAGQVPPPDAIIPLVPSGRNEPYVIQIVSPEWLERLSVDPLNRVTLSGAIAR